MADEIVPKVLKPCPFCGADGQELDIRTRRAHDVCLVACLMCGAEGPLSQGVDAATNSWNLRGQPREIAKTVRHFVKEDASLVIASLDLSTRTTNILRNFTTLPQLYASDVKPSRMPGMGKLSWRELNEALVGRGLPPVGYNQRFCDVEFPKRPALDAVMVGGRMTPPKDK